MEGPTEMMTDVMTGGVVVCQWDLVDFGAPVPLTSSIIDHIIQGIITLQPTMMLAVVIQRIWVFLRAYSPTCLETVILMVTLKNADFALVGEMIRQNGGAVTAEQLAPFCDDAPMPLDKGDDEERAYVDESFVLSIVTQLDGEPQVTEEGDIVYIFPELMTTSAKSSSSLSSKEMTRLRRESRILRRAGLEEDAPTSQIKTLLSINGISTRGALERSDLIEILEDVLPDDDKSNYMDMDVDDPTLLLEREYKFSLASSFQTVLAGLLGIVNLGGALYLGNLLGQYALYGVRLPSYMGLVQQFFPLLLAYAVLFNAIPLVRNIWLSRQNDKIRRRNEVRRSWKSLLELKAGSVKRKLMSTARMGKKLKQLGSGGRDIIFDTSKEFAEMEKVKEADEMAKFDKMLEEKAWE